MRLPTDYEMYLYRMMAYYKIRNLEQPSWIESARKHYSLLYYVQRELGEICSNTNIPKSKMEWLALIKDKSGREWTDLPEELKKETTEINICLSELYNELIDGKDVNTAFRVHIA